MILLKRFAAAVDGLNERIGAAIRWLALFMVLLRPSTAAAKRLRRIMGGMMPLRRRGGNRGARASDPDVRRGQSR